MQPHSITPPPRSMLALTGTLLRSPSALIPSPSQPSAPALTALAPSLLGVTLLGAGVFGVVVGSYRGSIQYLYAALKTPLLFLIPVVIALPALRAFLAACELRIDWSRLALAALVASARTAVLAAAVSPVLWLFLSLHPNYHLAILAMAATLVLVGAPGMWTLTSCLPIGGRHRPLAHAATFALLGVLLAQTGWLLRPFVVRPRAEIAFLRPIEADVFSSLTHTGASVQGRYEGWEARGGGMLGREASDVDVELDAQEVP